MENSIKRTDLLKDVFAKYPILREVFIQKSMRCVGCEILDFETIEESCINHCVDNIEEFITELNNKKDNLISVMEEIVD